MSLKVSQQIIYWSAGLVALIAFVWLLGGTLMPFLVGMGIAYFLDPLVDKLEALRLPRAVATAFISIGSVLIIVLALLTLLPELQRQIVNLITALPDYFAIAQTLLNENLPTLAKESPLLERGIAQITARLESSGDDLIGVILSSAFGIIDILIFMVVTPVVAFYMLLDWDNMVAKIDSWLPRDHRADIRGLALEMDRVLAGFVRGQLSVCAILGGFYAVTLALVGLQFGLVVGLVAGLLSFIPYVGATIGGVLAIGLALFQFWGEPQWIIAVAAIFVIGQTAEGNILTPKLVGGSVGLHPVWLMFSLSAFGALAGFTGLLLAVPMAACIGVVSRFAIGRYLQGRLYQGADFKGKAVKKKPRASKNAGKNVGKNSGKR
ncbi:MAG: AI-2E family transporter [Candidatus Halichondribacter symbioticus]